MDGTQVFSHGGDWYVAIKGLLTLLRPRNIKSNYIALSPFASLKQIVKKIFSVLMPEQ